jgi:hypothetical protein
MKKRCQDKPLGQFGGNFTTGFLQHDHQILDMAPDTEMVQVVMGWQEYCRKQVTAMIQQGE